MADHMTEARHPLSDGLHAQEGAVVMAHVLQAQAAAVAAVGPAIPALLMAADAGAAALGSGGKLAYAGAGSSGLMAMADCLELPGTFGIAPDRVPMMFAGGVGALLHMVGSVEDDTAMAMADVEKAGVGSGDTVLCLAASGATPYTVTIAKAARQRGAKVVGISNTAGSPLLGHCDIAVLLATGPEIVTGSTRMAAGTAQKVALNMLSVMIAIKLGHVHDGYMINLVADNAKLVDRAARIVADLAGVDRKAAENALRQTKGAVKPAILIARGMSPDQAQASLDHSKGHLAQNSH